MRTRSQVDRRCAYVVVFDDPDASVNELRDLAAYLSSLGVAGCDVVVVDDTPSFDRNRRILRWVGRHVAPLPRHRAFTGAVDPLRAAFDLASNEKIIIAAARVRYDAAAIMKMCELLDAHDVVEPQEYFEPLPWWGGIDAGRMLVHRGVEPLPDHGATFGFRRSAIRGMRGLDLLDFAAEDDVHRLQSQGADVHSGELFVRSEPPVMREWLRERARLADADFVMPVKTAFFFSLLPIAMLLIAFGGARLAGGYAGAIAVGSLALALRGRAGAAPFFPLRACLFAPLWVLERSLSVYWALLRKVRGVGNPRPVPSQREPGCREAASHR